MKNDHSTQALWHQEPMFLLNGACPLHVGKGTVFVAIFGGSQAGNDILWLRMEDTNFVAILLARIYAMTPSSLTRPGYKIPVCI